VELRQLEAFVAVATELHFGRAAERLHIGQPTLSELVQRLEREVGTPLLTRTTRRVALTGAGFELLGRAKVILDDVAAATAAVRRIAHGDAGTVRLGIVPPVAPVLAPHLVDAMGEQAPEVQNPNGQPGVTTVFSNQNDTRKIGDDILILPDADTAVSQLDEEKAALGNMVTGGTPHL
jgi:DNA-binding transcriptional LysR family regulator